MRRPKFSTRQTVQLLVCPFIFDSSVRRRPFCPRRQPARLRCVRVFQVHRVPPGDQDAQRRVLRRDRADVGAERRAGQPSGHLQGVRLLHAGAGTHHPGGCTAASPHTSTFILCCPQTSTNLLPLTLLLYFLLLYFLTDVSFPSISSKESL